MYSGGYSVPRTPSTVSNAYPDDVYSVIRDVLHAIGDIDYKHAVEIHNVDKNSSDEIIRRYAKHKIRSAYQKRRQSYIDLLNTLRMQQQP